MVWADWDAPGWWHSELSSPWLCWRVWSSTEQNRASAPEGSLEIIQLIFLVLQKTLRSLGDGVVCPRSRLASSKARTRTKALYFSFCFSRSIKYMILFFHKKTFFLTVWRIRLTGCFSNKCILLDGFPYPPLPKGLEIACLRLQGEQGVEGFPDLDSNALSSTALALT